MTLLNKTTFTIRLRRMLGSALRSAAYHLEGEPLYATDEKRLYVSDGTALNSVAGIVCKDIAVYNDAIVTSAGNVVTL